MSRKTNRDHAKKKQRPMVEDRVIAEHLTELLTPTITSQSKFFRELGLLRKNSHAAFDGSSSFDPVVA
jgi:hypothetical protein